MKYFFLAIVLLVSTPYASANPDAVLEPNPQMSYLIFEVSTTYSKRKPTWLGVAYQNRELLHLPNGHAIVEVQPGDYEIRHIDFGESAASGKGSVELDPRRSFTVEAGKIYILGVMNVSKIRRTQYKLSYSINEQLMKTACLKAKKVFSSFPVRGFDRAQERKLICPS